MGTWHEVLKAPRQEPRLTLAPYSQEPQQTSRREVVGVLASAAALLSAAPARAFLGIGEGQEKLDTYTEDTVRRRCRALVQNISLFSILLHALTSRNMPHQQSMRRP